MLKTISIILLSMILCLPSVNAQKKKQNDKAKKENASKTNPKQSEYNKFSEIPLAKVVILDSVVCSENDIIANVPIPHHAGILRKDQDGNVFQVNDFGDMRIYSQKNADGNNRIYRQELLGNEWSSPEELNIETNFTDMTNPFLLADGQTLYFAARDVNAQDKSYNIYMSALDTETGAFKKPMELSLPYRSSFDDIYYIADEADSLAWFITNRSQPEGMVCIYTVRTTQPWQYYDAEDLSQAKFLELAKISDISATWPSVEERTADLQRMHETLMSYADNDASATTTDNVSATKKALQKRQKELSRQLNDDTRKLAEYRNLYHNSRPASRHELVSTITSLEESVEKTRSQLRSISHELKP